MSPIVFALISYFGWAIGDVFGTVAARKLDVYSVTFWSYLLRVLIFSLYIPFALPLLVGMTASLLLLNLVLGIALLVGFISFNESLRSANPSLAGTIAAAFTALVVILSLLFLRDTLTFSQGLAIVIIFFGLFLSTLNVKDVFSRKVKIDRGVMFALLAMLMWGIYFTFVKIPVREIGWFWPNYISFLLFPILFLLIKSRKLELRNINYSMALRPLIASVLLTGIAEFSFNFGISRGLTSLVAPIAGSYPTLFAVLAFVIFKDPLTKQQKFAIPVTLVGIVMLALLS